MTITLHSAETVPELTFDKLSLVNLSIDQVLSNSNIKVPEYKLTLQCKRYAIDSENKRHYKRVEVIRLEDVLSSALASAKNGDDDLLNAIGAIEKAVALVYAEYKGISATTIQDKLKNGN